MKKLLLLLIIITTFSCCSNDDDNTPTNPIDQLPPATQTGANTAGCLVNGNAFLPNNQSVQPLVCNYLDGEVFTLGISRKDNDVYYKVYIYISSSLEVGQTYHLNTEFGTNAKSGEYFINNEPSPSLNYYSTTPSITGELTITHHDFNNAFLSGTFWFNAINSNGEIIEVREGRFDMDY